MDFIDKLCEPVDDRRDIIIAGDKFHTIQLAVKHILQSAQEAISERGVFHIALSGGSTPKAIFSTLSVEPQKDLVDWSKVYLWWSDERAVDADHPESNYRMAMEAGFASLNIPKDQIFRMKGEEDIEAHALEYEALIQKHVPESVFDLVMLGMGEDGHTASLFPETHGLHSEGRLVVANFIPKLKTWRMTLTYQCINSARQIIVYVIGENKADMLKTILETELDPDRFPLQGVGTPSNKALYILDDSAGKKVVHK
jgi:6-phosphogluconolactonase